MKGVDDHSLSSNRLVIRSSCQLFQAFHFSCRRLLFKLPTVYFISPRNFYRFRKEINQNLESGTCREAKWKSFERIYIFGSKGVSTYPAWYLRSSGEPISPYPIWTPNSHTQVGSAPGVFMPIVNYFVTDSLFRLILLIEASDPCYSTLNLSTTNAIFPSSRKIVTMNAQILVTLSPFRVGHLSIS